MNVNSIPEMDNGIGPARVEIIISTGSSSEKILESEQAIQVHFAVMEGGLDGSVLENFSEFLLLIQTIS